MNQRKHLKLFSPNTMNLLYQKRIITTLIAFIALGTTPIAAAELIPSVEPACQGCYLGASMAASDLNPGVGQSGHTLNGRWVSSSQTATSPNQGDPITLSWGFTLDGATVGASTGSGRYAGINQESTAPSSFIAFLDGQFGNGGGGTDLTNRPWFAKFDDSFNYLSNICGLNFVYESADDGVVFRGSGTNGIDGTRADIRIAGIGLYNAAGDSIGSPIATAAGVGGGDVMYNLNNLGFIQQGSFVGDPIKGDRAYRNVTMHEVMHSVGVSHNSIAASTTPLVPKNNTLINPFSTTAFDGVQHLDILPLQRAYGDVYETGNGNDTPQFATQIGDILDFRGIGLDGDIPFGQITPNHVDFISIDGDTDTDYYEFTVSELGAVEIILKPLGLEFNASTGDLVNTAELSDLTLELRNASDNSLIAQSNVAGLGGMESIIASDLSPGNYLIKVVGSQDFAQFYSITSTFTPSAPFLLLTAPEGGESWFVDHHYDITWRTNLDGNVKIELLMGGSVSTIAANTPNNGSYRWTIPPAQALAGNYRIRVTSIDNPEKTDQSAADFSIALNPLAVALDTTGLVWSNNERFGWFNQAVTTNDGVDAAMSEDIRHGESSSMETTLQGPGVLTFWWKVSTDAGYDFLRFFIDDVEAVAGISELEMDWEQKTVVIPDGTHTVRWTYSKDVSFTSGADAGWVDQVVFTPDPTPYSNWEGGAFANAFNDTGANSDPDGDGVLNFVEFAFGTDPTANSGTAMAYTSGASITTAGMPILAGGSVSGFQAVFSRLKEYEAAGLTYAVEFSCDLGRWTESATGLSVLTGVESSGNYEAVSVPYPDNVPLQAGGTDAPKFFRVKVTFAQ
ncbi:MAG: Ser-Thr-rich GPI-anchored membrane family protein [Akkermansiaceae bacterium]